MDRHIHFPFSFFFVFVYFVIFCFVLMYMDCQNRGGCGLFVVSGGGRNPYPGFLNRGRLPEGGGLRGLEVLQQNLIQLP